MKLFFFCLLTFLHWKFSSPISPCQCDKATTNGTSACAYEIFSNNSIKSNCTCIESSYVFQINTTSNVISCVNQSSVVECIDTAPEDGVCDIEQNIRCSATVLSNLQRNIVKYLFYFVAAWIILWCVITIIVNAMHRNNGHHRYIHLYEELVIILLIVVIAVLNTIFAFNEKICKYIPILAQFFMALLVAAFLMEAIFAKSMVHGHSKKNGFLPAVLNYIFPILIAIIPTAASYFLLKDYYGFSYQFCFSTAPGNMFWAFVIPNWILIFFAGLQAQLSCLACDMTKKEQDQKQCFWAKRSAKSLMLLSLLLFTLWLLVLSAGNEQIFYLFIICGVLAIFTGPTIFVVHTFCHLNTCQRWGKNRFYKLCPEKPKKEKCDDDDDDLGSQEPIPKKQEPASSPGPLPNKVAPVEEMKPDPPKQEKVYPVHTESAHFYSWLTAIDNNARRSSEILFRPRVT